MLCGMADTQPGRSFDMRRSADESRLAASRLAASPTDVVHPGQAASFSHALTCDEVVGQPLRLAASPQLGRYASWPSCVLLPCAGLRSRRRLAASHLAASPESIPQRITLGRAASSSPPPSSASGIRPWAECVFCQPITNDSRRGCRAGQLPKGVVHARRRGPSPLTAGPPALTTHPNAQGSSPSGDGPSSLPAGGRRPKATQHNRRRTDQ